MNASKRQERNLYLWLLLLSSLTGISIWYGRRLIAAPLADWGTQTMETFGYFTNLTNVLVIFMAASLLIGHGRLYSWFRKPSVQSGVCLYIAFVGLAFWFLLGGPTYAETAVDWLAELTAHTLSPILGAVYFARILSAERLEWKHPLLWLIYPLAYLAYWLWWGPLAGYYPYFFVDVNVLGYAGVARWTVILIIAFLFLGSLMLFTTRRRAV